jgi:hypothetical protein
MLSGHLFGEEVGKSGWSKRHIALRNWGHDPSKSDSPLYDADQVWLSEHSGAEQRRGNRISNPIVIASIEAEGVGAEDFRDLAPFLCPTARPCKPKRTRQGTSLTFVPDDHLYGDGEVYSDMPFGSNHSIKFGLLKQDSAPRVSHNAKRVGEAAFDQILDLSPRLDRGCMCQLAPAAMNGLAQRFDRFDRKPNPAIGAWILPIAQLLVSASGLYYSLSHLGDLASASMMSPEDKLIADAQNLRRR